MKKIRSLVFGIVVFFSLIGCLSTNTNNSVYSSNEKENYGNMIISSDDFADTKTVVHKDVGYDYFPKSSGIDMYFEPCFVYDNDNVACKLKIQCDYFGNDIITPKKIVLLGNDSKVIINITEKSSAGTNKLASGSILGTRWCISITESISKEDYIKLSEFYASNKVIRIGLYLSNNKMGELTEAQNKAHKIFEDASNYFREKLENKAGVPASNALIFQ